MAKKNNVTLELDSIQNLIGTILTVFIDEDFRIRKKKNREMLRSGIKLVVNKGFIRTHALVCNWLLELFEHGELNSLTFHEIIKKLPWSWDKTCEYINSLEKIGILYHSRNSSGKKICNLIVDKENRSRQIDNLIEYYKKNNSQNQTLNPINQMFLLNYFKKLNEWFSRKDKMKRIPAKIMRASDDEIDQFIFDITTIAKRFKGRELRINLLSLLKMNPLLLYSLKRC